MPLWEKWDKQSLLNKRAEIGPREFGRGWQQRALVDSELLFQPKFLEACLGYNDKLFFPGDSLDGIVNKSSNVFMGIDLAIAGSESQGDYFVISVISVDTSKFHRQILGIYRERGLTFNEQINTIERWAAFFNPILIFVESNAYQVSITQELQRTTTLPVKGFTTTSIRKSDLESGLPRMSLEFENERWTLPYADGTTRELITTLMEEMKTFPLGRHDDILMSLWFARSAAVDIDKKINKRIRVV